MGLRRRSTDRADTVERGGDSADSVRDPDDLEEMDDERAKSFFRRNATEVLRRMRQPSDPTNNIAALVVAKYAPDPRLRAEARRALEDARISCESRSALDKALDSYSQSPTTPLRAGAGIAAVLTRATAEE
jgi:hypothetical protein